MNKSGDLTKGGNVGSGSVLVHSQDEWRDENRPLKHTNSQSVLENHHLSGRQCGLLSPPPECHQLN
jgi:hypothetical protein